MCNSITTGHGRIRLVEVPRSSPRDRDERSNPSRRMLTQGGDVTLGEGWKYRGRGLYPEPCVIPELLPNNLRLPVEVILSSTSG